MKKLNKKGFTLIELLAVIIILGVLMIIAIPSVTEYISSSRKSAMVDTADGYIKAVMTKVNEAKDLKFFDTSTLYLVPVGHDTAKSCSPLEKGGASPFHDEWKYAYVGVTYNGSGYTYYFMAKDGSNQGINFIEQNELAKAGGDKVVSGMPDFLDTVYGTAKTYVTVCPENQTCDVWSTIAGSGDSAKMTLPAGVTNVVLVPAPSCAYSG